MGCTLTAEANNGCTFEDGDNDDDESTIADELGWLLDPDTGDRVVTAEGEYLCCRNCTNGDGDNPECKDNYEETRDGRTRTTMRTTTRTTMRTTGRRSRSASVVLLCIA